MAQPAWGSLDWLPRTRWPSSGDSVGYHALKRALKPGDQLWRYQPARPRPRKASGTLPPGGGRVRQRASGQRDYIYVGFNYWAWWDTSWLGITWTKRSTAAW